MVLCFLFRYYVQLPTEKSHEFHTDTQPAEEINKELNSRLHPNIGQKIRDMVSAGETRLYVIRKALRYIRVIVDDEDYLVWLQLVFTIIMICIVYWRLNA